MEPEKEMEEDQDVQGAVEAAAGALAATKAAVDALKHQGTEENQDKKDEDGARGDDEQPLMGKGQAQETDSDDRYIYDESELEQINDPASGREPIIYIKRYEGTRQRFGIRAHRDMNWQKCIHSIINPRHNEFLSIWLQVVIALFFWISLILDYSRVGVYGTIVRTGNKWIVHMLNFLFAVSATCTLLYLVFYPISKKVSRNLEIVHYSAILTVVTYLAFVLVLFELRASQYWIPFMVFLWIGLVAAICLLVFVDLAISQYMAFALVILIVTLAVGLDYFNNASDKMVNLFYIPLLMESLFLAFALVLFAFRLPELCCPQTRWVHLYLNSQLFLIIFTINFVYEVHNVYIRTVKLHEGSLSKEQLDSYLKSEF